MAGNDSRNNGERTDGGSERAHGSNSRDRKRDRIVEGVKSRPYAAAAAATVAAGAAAFFLTRGKSDKPLMKWGQDSDTGSASVSEQKDSARGARPSEMASASPSSAAAGKLSQSNDTSSSSGSTTPVVGADKAQSSAPKSGSTGLDKTADDQSKVGSIAYGA